MNRRTTVTADVESLSILEREAERRGIALTSILSEAVDEKARAIRQARPPRVGVGRSADGRSAAELTSEPIARAPA